MFKPKNEVVWEEKKDEVSLTRIANLINRIKSFIVTPDMDAFMKQIGKFRKYYVLNQLILNKVSVWLRPL